MVFTTAMWRLALPRQELMLQGLQRAIHFSKLCLAQTKHSGIVLTNSLNSFSGRLPISPSFIWSCGFLPFSFICNIFLCHLILLNLLCLWSPFCRMQGHCSSCFCCLPPGEWGCSRGLCILLRGRDWCLCSGAWSWVLSLWWAGQHQGVCFQVSMNLVQCSAACLLMGGAVFLCCWLFGLRHPALELSSSWVQPDLSAKMRLSAKTGNSGRAHAN